MSFLIVTKCLQGSKLYPWCYILTRQKLFAFLPDKNLQINMKHVSSLSLDKVHFPKYPWDIC